ncbi:hypothetical protein I6K87_00540 [Streptococcus anginosus]|jgi:hypothetical protein|uniref:hypothetical protein n=1 Tax=Streptococcus anginosus TaxID=1328 RepID=UPI00195655BB|nr:hypothetical protein [Streptococcus anginosus]QRR97671.1 hypothetical protein I6K87_00540 [Streptococcus anginosus]
MTENSDKKISKMMEEGFVLFLKNGIIKSAKLPEFGSLIITTQDGIPIQKETRRKEKI